MICVMHYAITKLADRSHDERVARSAVQRNDPGSVSYYVPVNEFQAAGGGQAAGFAWIFRTTGLVVLAMIGIVATMASLSGITQHPLANGPWLLVGMAVDGLVIRAVVRRRRAGGDVSRPPVTHTT